MARGLYRVYLYVVTIALLVFATITLTNALEDLLRLTPLRGYYESAPSASEVTQNVVFAVVSILIVAALGGLHYWLIRRDMASDPQPGASGVRSFTLNLAVGIATIVAVVAGASALQTIGQYYGNVASGMGLAIVVLALALGLEWERRRATPSHGAALVFQRLRIDGVGLILLGVLAGFLYQAVSQTQTAIAEGANILQCTTQAPPNGPYSGPYNGPYLPQCSGSMLVGAWAAVALVVIVWLLYLRTGALDGASIIRSIFLLLGLASGVSALVYALTDGVEYVLRLIVSTGVQPNYLNDFNFGPWLVFAAVALGVYLFRLRQHDAQEALGADATALSTRAVAGLIFAVPFWLGLDKLINDVILNLARASSHDTTHFHSDVATLVAGLAFIPLGLWLGVGTRATGVKGPRRAFVLALLAAGALITAGSLATLIYSVLTGVLGSPLPNSADVTREAGAALIVGLILGGLYLFIAIREGQFATTPKPTAPITSATPGTAPAGAYGSLVDSVLDRFASGAISRDEAKALLLDQVATRLPS